MDVLVFAGHYLPAYKAGGVIRTLANLVDQLGGEINFHIVTSDRDLGDAAAFKDVAANVWTPVGRANVFYRSPGADGWRALLASLGRMPFDLIYLNSVFSTDASLRPLAYRKLGRLAKRPVLLAPRGEFSPGALALKSVKKQAFIALAKPVGLYRDVIFQASSEHEAQDIRRIMGDVPISVAIDLAPRPATRSHDRENAQDAGGPLRAVFLSRISPKKNLLGAIEILAQVRTPMAFDIYGVIEDQAYWGRCQTAIAALPSHIQARYRRVLHPDEVITVLAEHDFFFLPTRGENYGHVIREALSAGLPALISDQTPWRGLAPEGIGADLPLDAPEAFVAWIEAFARYDRRRRHRMSQAARARGDDPAAAAKALEANRAMLLSAMGRAGVQSLRSGD